MCSYATKYAAKIEQKQVPDSFRDVGRFWGVWGLRKTLAATIGFRFNSEQKVQKVHRDMVDQLKMVLKGRASVRNMPGTNTVCLYLRDREVIEQVKSLMSQAGTLIASSLDAFFEMPELVMFEEQEE